MPMPKTALNLDDRSVASQHYVWASGELADMQAKPITKAIKCSTNNDLGLSVLRSNFRHQRRTFSSCLQFPVSVESWGHRVFKHAICYRKKRGSHCSSTVRLSRYVSIAPMVQELEY